MSRAEELYQQAVAGSFQPQEYETKSGFSTWQGFPARPTVEDLARVKEAAELGYPEAQYQMALYYLFEEYHRANAIGYDEEHQEKRSELWELERKDGQKGLHLLEEALKGGVGEAGLLLGDLYQGTACFVEASPEVKQDAAKAMAYYRAGAEQGCADAMYRLGACYYYGRGTAEDNGKAFAYFAEAQKNGSELMWQQLGECYVHGWGTQQNIPMAKECLENALEVKNWGDDDHARLLLGQFYLGVGGFEYADLDKAKEMLRAIPVNSRDYAKAQEYLGKLPAISARLNDWRHQNGVSKDGTVKKGCYVATCVYGSYDCPQVWTLRRFRDETLAATWYGRAFIRCYYAVSPTLVRLFGGQRWFRAVWKPRLDGMVRRLNGQGVADTPYQDRSW